MHKTQHLRLADDPERRKWQDPEAILAGIGLKPGMVLADIGCGGGFFALPAARIVGETGRVFGLDISATGIAALKKSADRAMLRNVTVIVGDAATTVPCEACADVVFFGIDLHDFADPAAVLRNARRTVKQNGRIVDLDWKTVDTAFGPPLEIRFSEQHAVKIIEEAGFRVTSVRDAGPYHYIIEAKPRGEMNPKRP